MPPMPLKPSVPDLRATCRFAATGCQYVATGAEAFVVANYRQHLKETHFVGCPRVEPEELVPAGAPIEDVDRILFPRPAVEAPVSTPSPADA